MNYRRLMNETVVANNGNMSRGLKNQLSIVSAYVSDDLEAKLDLLKEAGISIHNYMGLRILEFKYDDINVVISTNNDKLETYKSNPQELVRDLRKYELQNIDNLSYNEEGGM